MNIATPPHALTPWRIALALGLMLGLQIVFELALIQPQIQATEALKTKAQSAQSSRPLPKRAPLTQQLEDIQARLPLQQDTNLRIHQMHQQAEQNRVEIRKATYATSASNAKSNSLPRHEMAMELAGTYPDIRHFLRDLQAQDEAFAIDSLEFSRPNSQSMASPAGGVRARMQASLYYRLATP